MEYKEYGSKNNDIIILLHGGGLSWWNYIDEISLLENEFHIVIPILDGHSGSDTNFTSIESNALEIINFINKTRHLHMKAMNHDIHSLFYTLYLDISLFLSNILLIV